MTLEPPGVPLNVRATRDLAELVRVTFDPPARGMPSGYRVLRDGQVIATLDSDTRSHEDRAALPGTLGAPLELSASTGTDAAGVRLSWQAPHDVAPGPEHDYRVVALQGPTPGPESDAAFGRRAAPTIVGYEFSRDDEVSWVQVAGDATEAFDGDAPQAALSPGRAVAEPLIVPEHAVRLRIAEFGVEPARLTYRVRARAGDIVSPSSTPVIGHRQVQVPTFQWQRSRGSDDAFEDLSSVTGPSWYDADLGPGTEASYRVMVSVGALALPSTAAKVRVRPPLLAAAPGYGSMLCVVPEGEPLQCWGGDGRAPRGSFEGAFIAAQSEYNRVCALDDERHKVCWGELQSGQPGSERYAQLATGSYADCTIAEDDGRLRCAGSFEDRSSVGAVVPGDEAMLDVSLDNERVCGIFAADGALQCWGPGGLGPSERTQESYLDIEVGDQSPCAVGRGGQLSCWTRSGLELPEGSEGLSFARVGDRLAITEDGRLFVWGRANGKDGLWDEPRFATVAGDCAITRDGRLHCPGGRAGWLAAPTTTEDFLFHDGRLCLQVAPGSYDCEGEALAPVDAPDFERILSVVKGAFFTCVLNIEHRAHCWAHGQIPIPTPEPDELAPDGQYSSLVVTYQQRCGLRLDGHIECVANYHHPAGGPSSDLSEAGYEQLVAGYEHRCAVRADDGQVECWGSVLAAVVPDSMRGVRTLSLAAGQYHTCALREDQQLVCWGDNEYGQAPRGPRDASMIASLSAAGGTTCGLRHDGHLECWGAAALPTPGPSLGRYLKVEPPCALRVDGKVVCWQRPRTEDSLPLVLP